MKTTRLFTIITVIMIAATLTACGNAVVATTPVQDQPQVEPKQEVVAEPTAEVVEEQPEVTEEVAPVVEEEPENPEEATYADYHSADILFEESIKSENREASTLMAIWDCESQKAYFLEAGKEYDIANGDVIIVCQLIDDEDIGINKDGILIPHGSRQVFERETKESDNIVKQYYTATNLSESFEFVYEPYADKGNHKYDFRVTLNVQ